MPIKIITESLEVLTFDLENDENTTQKIRLTDNPVMDGSVMTDHAIIEPTTITLDVAVSDNTPQGDDVWSGTGSLRSNNAYTKLTQIKLARKLVTLELDHGTYKNMMLIDVPYSKTSETVGTWRGTLEFREVQKPTIEITTNKYAKAKQKSNKHKSSAQPKKNMGSVPLSAVGKYSPDTSSWLGNEIRGGQTMSNSLQQNQSINSILKNYKPLTSTGYVATIPE